MKRVLIALILLMVIFTGASAGTEYQVRSVCHFQQERQGWNFAAWGIVPDARYQPYPKFLGLGGVVFKTQSQWIELLAGGLHDPKRGWDPIVDIRYSRNQCKVGIFGEVYYSHSVNQLMVQSRITHAVTVGYYAMRVGAEAEIFFQPKHDIQRIGPAIVLPFSHMGSSSFAVVYYFNNDATRLVRTYFVLQPKFRKHSR